MAIPPSLVVCMILPCRLVFIGGVLEPEEWVGARQLVARRQVEMDGHTGHAACSPDARGVGARDFPSWRLRWCNMQYGARYICAAIGSYFIPSDRSFDGIVSSGVEERCQCSQVMYPAVNQAQTQTICDQAAEMVPVRGLVCQATSNGSMLYHT